MEGLACTGCTGDQDDRELARVVCCHFPGSKVFCKVFIRAIELYQVQRSKRCRGVFDRCCFFVQLLSKTGPCLKGSGWQME